MEVESRANQEEFGKSGGFLTTEEVVDRHLAAFAKGIDALLADYAEDAVVITENDTFNSKKEIETFFQLFVDGLPDGFWQAFQLKKRVVEGNIGYLVWSAAPFIRFGVDTLVVSNGKIVAQTVAVDG